MEKTFWPMLPLPNLGSFRFSVTQFFSRTSTSCPLPEGENTLHGVLHVTKFFAENFCQQTTVYISLSQIKKQCIETKFQTDNRSQSFVTRLQKASRCEHQEASTTTDDKSSNSNKYSISSHHVINCRYQCHHLSSSSRKR